eukprot:9990962-Lingulodinium_polyedra.AAC.1
MLAARAARARRMSAARIACASSWAVLRWIGGGGGLNFDRRLFSESAVRANMTYRAGLAISASCSGQRA